VLHFASEFTRDRTAEPQIFLLKLLQPAKLVTPHPAILLVPSIVRLLRYADLTDRIRYRLALALQNFYLAQFRYDLFRFVSLACHLLILL